MKCMTVFVAVCALAGAGSLSLPFPPPPELITTTCLLEQMFDADVRCDVNGLFPAKQCDNATGECYCVVPETGHRIPGSTTSSGSPLDCSALTPCQQAYQEADQFSFKNPDIMDGANIVCDADGHYVSQQCVSYTTICSCVVPQTGTLIPGLDYRDYSELDCKALTPCQEEFKSMEAMSYQRRFAEMKPERLCRDDGHYYPKQCNIWGSDCWCVVPETGLQLPGSGLSLNCYELTPCQRQYQQAQNAADAPTCDDDGNFDPTQCNRSHCWCVDPVAGTTAPDTASVPIAAAWLELSCGVPSCPPGKIYSRSAGCDVTCANRGKPLPCTLLPRRKCVCPPDAPYVHGDECLHEHQCIASECKAELNEEFNECSAACDNTCAQPTRPCSWPRRCVPRCGCPTGHVRNEDNVCIPINECPSKECPPTQVFSMCAGCDETCENRGTVVCMLACQPKCTCPPEAPYLDGNVCVPASECPPLPECDEQRNEVYSSCHSACDATCDEPNLMCMSLLMCTSRCGCPDGHVRNDQNVCVELGSCPALET